VLLNPVAGLQMYELAPVALSVVGRPLQIAVFGETVRTGCGFTVTVVCTDDEQPLASVPVTVYVIVAAGVEVMDEPVVLLK